MQHSILELMCFILLLIRIICLSEKLIISYKINNHYVSQNSKQKRIKMFHSVCGSQYLSIDYIKNCENRHIASESHIRIHLSEIQYKNEEHYFDFHGELLIIIIEGTGIIKTKLKEIEVNTNDQILLINGESFFFTAKNENTTVKAEFVWTPGMNPCKDCWEISNRFYREEK